MPRSSVRAAPAALTNDVARASYARAASLLHRLQEAGFEAYLVGGGIRDLLVGRNPRDWDIATAARPEEVLSLWPDAVPTGIRHGTVTVTTAGEPVEITTFRTEGPYSDGRHPDRVTFVSTLDEDLSRRDFTVNAMAFDPERRLLVDPEGGAEDLERRLLRTVGNPDARFAEDGLRPLRGIRLAAELEFAVAPEVREAMARAKERVAGVARERVRDELMKMLEAAKPSRGIELLRETGLLDVVLPELGETVGVTQNRFHAYDVYRHSLEALDAAPRDRPRVRLAALLHDVGKPRTKRVVNGEGTFYGHQKVGAEMVRRILDRLRISKAERDAVAHLVEEHMFHYTPDWSDAAVRRFVRRVGAENLEDLFALRRADTSSHGTDLVPAEPLDELKERIEQMLAREEAMHVRDLAVDGDDLMEALGLQPGPEVGRLLNALLERVLEDPSRNRKEILLETARDLHRRTAAKEPGGGGPAPRS